MAKHNCEICGAEVGLLAQIQLADKKYICRKVCAKRCLKIFDFVPSTIEQVTAHIEQVEYGTKVWEQVFVPLLSAKDKNTKIRSFGQYGMLRVSPSTGLVALIQNDYKFFVFGKTTKACVYRLADLYTYEYETEVTRNSEGKDVTLHYCHMGFGGTNGLSEFRLPISSQGDFTEIDKYFDKMFGIQKTLGNIGNTFKSQINAAKAVAGALKSIKNKEDDMEEKSAEAIDAMNALAFGDRTKWAELADNALACVK